MVFCGTKQPSEQQVNGETAAELLTQVARSMRFALGRREVGEVEHADRARDKSYPGGVSVDEMRFAKSGAAKQQS